MKTVFECKTHPELYAYKSARILLDKYYQSLTITERIYCKPFLFSMVLPLSNLSFMSLHGKRFGSMMCDASYHNYYKKRF